MKQFFSKLRNVLGRCEHKTRTFISPYGRVSNMKGDALFKCKSCGKYIVYCNTYAGIVESVLLSRKAGMLLISVYDGSTSVKKEVSVQSFLTHVNNGVYYMFQSDLLNSILYASNKMSALLVESRVEQPDINEFKKFEKSVVSVLYYALERIKKDERVVVDIKLGRMIIQLLSMEIGYEAARYRWYWNEIKEQTGDNKSMEFGKRKERRTTK